MKVNFTVSALINASPQQVYNAWLDSKHHSAMTGAEALVSNKIGAEFEAWDGYIKGKNISLEPGKRIIQEWRTSEFSDSDEDSILDIQLESDDMGCIVIIQHSRLPEHGMQYKQGWVDAYFTPMKNYFT